MGQLLYDWIRNMFLLSLDYKNKLDDSLSSPVNFFSLYVLCSHEKMKEMLHRT